ncbi:hypothetical protein PR048_017351 [Dryococelus australis]|uniref:PiggyBac transposable element-derived protein domain-containing protein n=1 Tax=Dryococelus australis TaxID=614101 RepID=A0ABQ9H9A2_9NEOP|nr:hypothetical protein PR048_017351 [Dryococelus australis]
MIPYFGRHGCKQFLRLKPVRFGFKACIMTQSSGYCLAADLYQRKNPVVRDLLICSLPEKGMKGPETARINRMGKCPIADKKVMQKRERGSYEVISAVAWRDNNVVYTLSNEHGVQPVQYANRYSSKEKKSLQVTQSNTIHKYDKFMGGVELLDNKISNYRIGI